MTYKTILAHAGSGTGAEQAIRMACVLARSMNAHLVGGAPTGISRYIPPAVLRAGGPAVAARCDALRRAAADALARFEHIAAAEGVDSFESRAVDDEIDAALALQARYCDLVVVGQSTPGTATPPMPADLPGYLLLTSGQPVLVVPAAASPPAAGTHAVVGWDASVEAARAVTGALPLLHAAGRVTVVGFGFGFGEEATSAGSGDDACEELATWLQRHGVNAHGRSLARAGDIGEALLSEATDAHAGLLVMGGYGHARFRELMLGGVTATVLRAMKLPVLFAH